jgi:hypothetical protein
VIDFLRLLGYSVIGVNFGSGAMMPLGGEKCYNKRAEMYCSTRTWLHQGCIPNDQALFKELVSIEFGHAKQGKLEGAILLAPKEELDESPDWADALVLTFAYPVSAAFRGMNKNSMKADYDPLGFERVNGFSNPDPKPLFDPKNPGANARSFH